MVNVGKYFHIWSMWVSWASFSEIFLSIFRLKLTTHLKKVAPIRNLVKVFSWYMCIPTPPKTNMTIEKQPFEDVSPSNNGDSPLSRFPGVEWMLTLLTFTKLDRPPFHPLDPFLPPKRPYNFNLGVENNKKTRLPPEVKISWQYKGNQWLINP